MAKILITGSKGVVGSFLTKILKERGHDVFGIDLYHDINERGWERIMADGPFEYVRCDIAHYRQLERVLKEVGPFDYVYNTAAEFGRWNGEDYYEQLWTSNVIGFKNIVRLQEKLGFKLIHFSSSEVYGDYDGVMKEEIMDNIAIKQMNDYAMTKWVNEMQINNSAIMHGTETVIVRLFNTYGPGETYHPYRSVNSKFCYHLLHGIPVTVFRGHYRTSSYLEDTCRTLANIVENFKPGAVYNIAGIEHHSIEDLVELVWQASRAPRNLINYQDSEILTTKNKKVNADKAISDLDHKITVSLEEGIKRTVDWMKRHYNI